MKAPETAEILVQFDRLQQAVADTSSLIYLRGIDLLALTARNIELLIVSPVAEEFGPTALPENVRHLETGNGGPADRVIIDTARSCRLPLLSEDRRLLLQAEAVGLPYFNTLMVMNFLVYRDRLTGEAYRAALCRLMGFARYSSGVYRYGQTVFEAIALGKSVAGREKK